MSILKKPRVLMCAWLLLAAPAAQAQWAVVDVGAIAQLVEQVATMREQLETARDQLSEAQRQLAAMTGGRGMEQLLAGTVRNYLPPDWASLEAVMREGAGSYPALSGELAALLGENAVLTASHVESLSPAERAELEAARRFAALRQATVREALSQASGRFTALQQLIDEIGQAQDQKAILDLQARVTAEQGMLTNEQIKLDLLERAIQAEESARRQRVREQAVSGIGSLRRLPAMGL